MWRLTPARSATVGSGAGTREFGAPGLGRTAAYSFPVDDFHHKGTEWAGKIRCGSLGVHYLPLGSVCLANGQALSAEESFSMPLHVGGLRP